MAGADGGWVCPIAAPEQRNTLPDSVPRVEVPIAMFFVVVVAVVGENEDAKNTIGTIPARCLERTATAFPARFPVRAGAVLRPLLPGMVFAVVFVVVVVFVLVVQHAALLGS